MAPELIAQACYEAEQIHGGMAGPPWRALQPAQQQAVLARVREHLADPDKGPKAEGKTSTRAEVDFRKLVLTLADGV